MKSQYQSKEFVFRILMFYSFRGIWIDIEVMLIHNLTKMCTGFVVPNLRGRKHICVSFLLRHFDILDRMFVTSFLLRYKQQPRQRFTNTVIRNIYYFPVVVKQILQFLFENINATCNTVITRLTTTLPVHKLVIAL